jgi:hypothetical protein
VYYFCTVWMYKTRTIGWGLRKGGGMEARRCSGRVESTWAGLRIDRRYPLLRVSPLRASRLYSILLNGRHLATQRKEMGYEKKYK